LSVTHKCVTDNRRRRRPPTTGVPLLVRFEGNDNAIEVAVVTSSVAK
jgi:hypothetical protein